MPFATFAKNFAFFAVRKKFNRKGRKEGAKNAKEKSLFFGIHFTLDSHKLFAVIFKNRHYFSVQARRTS
jgi:hypothetical protein